MTTAELLSLVMADVQSVGKEGFNKAQGFNFRGVDAVVNAVGPALRKHGLVVLPRVINKSHRDFETTKGALMHECVVEVEYTFTAEGCEPLVCSSVGESADSGDKATAKAMSVAYRTMWLQALCIPTDEPDPDEMSVQRGAPEMIPSAEAKTRLVAKSSEAIAKQLWGDRPNEPISIVALDALLDVAEGMKKHEDKKAAGVASAQTEEP